MYLQLSLVALVLPILTRASVNACSDEDKAIFVGSHEFANRLSDYAVRSFGMWSGTVDKIKATYPSLNATCADCFGEAVACGTRTCFFKCAISSTSEACVACSTAYCRPRLLNCVGAADESELPPPPGDKPAPIAPATRTRQRKLTESKQDSADDEELFDFVQIVFGSGESLPVFDEDELTLSFETTTEHPETQTVAV